MVWRLVQAADLVAGTTHCVALLQHAGVSGADGSGAHAYLLCCDVTTTEGTVEAPPTLAQGQPKEWSDANVEEVVDAAGPAAAACPEGAVQGNSTR